MGLLTKILSRNRLVRELAQRADKNRDLLQSSGKAIKDLVRGQKKLHKDAEGLGRTIEQISERSSRTLAGHVWSRSSGSGELESSLLNPEVTILVPTCNRPAYLKRLLGYFGSIMHGGTVVVADGSFGEAAEQSAAIIDAFRKTNATREHPTVLQVIQSSLPLYPRLLLALEQVTTPYVFWIGDDDLVLVGPPLDAVVDYLNGHPGYSYCNGHTIRGWSNMEDGRIERCYFPHNRERFAGTFEDPIRNFCGIYYGFVSHGGAGHEPDLVYGMRRTAQFRETIRLICDNPLLAKWAEIVMLGCTCLQGKIGSIDAPVLWRDASAPSSAKLLGHEPPDAHSPAYPQDAVQAYAEVLKQILQTPARCEQMLFSEAGKNVASRGLELAVHLLVPDITVGEGSEFQSQVQPFRFEDVMHRPARGWLEAPLDFAVKARLAAAESATNEGPAAGTFSTVRWF